MNDQRQEFVKVIIPIGSLITFLGSLLFLWAYFFQYENDPDKWIILLISIICFFASGYGYYVMKRHFGWFQKKK